MRTKINVRAVKPDPKQPVFSGVSPVTTGERLTWLAGEPMRASRAQRPLDIGFWAPMRNQIEMF